MAAAFPAVFGDDWTTLVLTDELEREVDPNCGVPGAGVVAPPENPDSSALAALRAGPVVGWGLLAPVFV